MFDRLIHGEPNLECVCVPDVIGGRHASALARRFFHDCLYTPVDFIAFSLGCFSLLLFMLCLFPQIAQDAEWVLISKFFRTIEGKLFVGSALLLYSRGIELLFGDLFNVAGCILGHQLPTQTITGVYFCLMDMVLLGQMAYYARGSRFRLRSRRSQTETALLDDAGFDVPDSEVVNPGSSIVPVPLLALVLVASGALITVSTGIGHHIRLPGRHLLGVGEQAPNCIYSADLTQLEFVLGSIVSWASGLLYFCSRIPQVYVNYVTKSCSGLSISMFILTVTSNCAYGASILLRFPPINGFFFAITLPFLIGSIGTLVFDVMILIQLKTLTRVPSE